MVDWEGRAARATERYENGAARLPDQPDERQRQLVSGQIRREEALIL